MAGLLDTIKRGGRGLLEAADALGQYQYAPDGAAPAGYEEDPMVLAARKQYDTNYRAARAQAIRQGARWYEMGDIAGAAANQRYGADLTNALSTSEALRARREKNSQREAIRKYVMEGAGLESMSDEQRQFLQAVDPDTATPIIAQQLFPEAMGSSSSQAFATQVDADGHIWTISRDNRPTMMRDPETGRPLRAQDPADIRTLQALQNDPNLMDAIRGRNAAGAYGTQEGEANVQARLAAAGGVAMARRQIPGLQQTLEKVKQLPTGVIAQNAKFYNSELRELDARLSRYALENIGRMKAAGVNLGQITVVEFEKLMGVEAGVDKPPATNIALIESRIRDLQQLMEDSEAVLDYLDAGGSILKYRIPGTGPAPAAAPAQAPAAGPVQSLGNDVPLPPPVRGAR